MHPGWRWDRRVDHLQHARHAHGLPPWLHDGRRRGVLRWHVLGCDPLEVTRAARTDLLRGGMVEGSRTGLSRIDRAVERRRTEMRRIGSGGDTMFQKLYPCGRISRRRLLHQAAGGFLGVALGALWARAGEIADADLKQGCGPHLPARAKSVIYLFMCGGVSHID